MLWRRELLKSLSSFSELVMKTRKVVAPVRLVVLPSFSGDGLLCCLK